MMVLLLIKMRMWTGKAELWLQRKIVNSVDQLRNLALPWSTGIKGEGHHIW